MNGAGDGGGRHADREADEQAEHAGQSATGNASDNDGGDNDAQDESNGRLETTWSTAKQGGRDLVAAGVRRLPPRLRGLTERIDRDTTMVAAGLAFYGLVSALPMLLIGFAVVEAVAGDEALQDFADEASDTGPEGTGQFLDQLVETGGSLTLVTVLFTVWPATAYGGGLRRAMLRSVPEEGTLPGLRGRVLGLSVVLALPVLMLAGLPLMFVVTTLTGNGLLGVVLGWALALVAAMVIGTGLTTLLYQAFVPGTLGWKETIQGASVTAAVTAVFSVLFVVYLNVGQVEDRFGGGTVAIVVLLGVWLFVANILLLAGYEAVLELEDDG